MTETKWLACADPKPMLTFLRGKASDRKLRLFMAGCCRRVFHTFTDDEDEDREEAIDIAERYADGLASEEEREDALGERTDGRPDLVWDYCTNLVLADFVKTRPDDADGVDCAIGAAEEALLDAVNERYEEQKEIHKAEKAAQADLLRCVFGPLGFREIVVVPAWLTWNRRLVRKLAQAAYEERQLPAGALDPQRLGVLADALEDAGCDIAELLAHLRADVAHIRGCWAVDLLLGKE
jgi:hypothetical protein